MKTKIQPLYDRVLIKEDIDSKEKKTSSGIIIPTTVAEDKSNKQGTIVAVGSGRVTEEGKSIKMSVKVGDKVIFQWGEKVKVGDEEYYIVRESEISALIK